jgi:predicted transposase YbfD/YdcC
MGMAVEKLVEHFSALEDPRCAGKVDHRLIDILVIAVCAVIACAESWDDIALYGRNKLGWLRSFLTLANGIPSHDTLARLHADRPGCLRGLLQRLGSVFCRGL